jgi:hypothetical protein
MKGYYDVIRSAKIFILYGDEPEPWITLTSS